MVFLDATPEKMREMAEKFRENNGLYQVLRKDKDVHVAAFWRVIFKSGVTALIVSVFPW